MEDIEKSHKNKHKYIMNIWNCDDNSTLTLLSPSNLQNLGT
jgi:hypothetical protein